MNDPKEPGFPEMKPTENIDRKVKRRAPRLPLIVLGTLGALCCPVTSSAVDAAEDEAFFEKEIRPILIERCYECHSSESGKTKGGLALDTREGWSRGGDSGPAIVPGKPDESLLVEAIRYENADVEMPPKGKLRENEIALLTQWVGRGAPDPRTESATKARGNRVIDIETGRRFWSFRPVRTIAPPEVRQGDWPRGDSDRFLLAALEAEGLSPSPDAEPDRLLRRVTFDLTGLPPAPDDTEEFTEAVRRHGVDAALASIVDRLLDSRPFAEKWARHWLDLARYADTNGSSFNPPYRAAWRYRNWVIDATEADLPYDEFVIRQIAGDLLPEKDQATRDANLIATGYLTLGSKVLGLFDKEQLTLDVVDEQIDTIGKGMLGMTLGCVRCHDHKFDPIPQADYYALAGIFTSTETLHDRIGSKLDDESDWVRRGLGEGGDERLRAFLDENRYAWEKAGQKRYGAMKKIADLEAKLTDGDSGDERSKMEADLAKARADFADYDAKLRDFEARMPTFAMGVRDMDRPADTRIRIRGVPSSPGDTVPRGFLQVASFPNQPKVDSSQSGRLELARWIASPSHPLTARVRVNRVWRHLFGQGLVRTADNFGATGEIPSHPELLDWLADRFVNTHQWRLKPLIRELVLSHAYRMESTYRADAAAVDPENRLLWRQNRRRLEAEELRDSLLAISGQLDTAPDSAGRLDHLPLTDLQGNDSKWIGDWDLKRTVYQPIVRNMVDDVLEVFDFADPSTSTGERSSTQVAPQALYLLNSPFVRAAADHTAIRLAREIPGREVEPLVRRAFEWIINRPPSPGELADLSAYLELQFEGPPGPTDHDIGKLCQALFASTQFQFVD
ncbi:MAG: PSD1 domain-containing protein [Verrucomicrobiae bacterium]|nr:PSD1 domain-containing protein [Verrucomicrobiae bacterium]